MLDPIGAACYTGAALSDGDTQMVLGPGSKKQLKVFAQLGSIGIELALSTVLGLLGGRWLDGKLGTNPFLTILGLLVGIAAGFRSLIRTARKASRPDPQDTNTRDDG